MPSEGRPKLYVRVPGWWENYSLGRAILVPTNALQSYASQVLVDGSAGWKAICIDLFVDRYVMVLFIFLQRVFPADKTIRLNSIGCGLRMWSPFIVLS